MENNLIALLRINILGLFSIRRGRGNAHVDYLVGNVSQRVALLGPIIKNINMYMTDNVYTSFFLPILDYCDAECNYCGSVNADRLDKLQS